MTRLGPGVSYKIVPEESLSIIGSSSKDEPGELYTIDIRYQIAQPVERRNKRMLDIGVCLGLIVTLPVWLLFSKKKAQILNNWVAVLFGEKTWVGYARQEKTQNLPKLKPGIFSPLDSLGNLQPDENTIARLNFFYARNWEPQKDWTILWQAFTS